MNYYIPQNFTNNTTFSVNLLPNSYYPTSNILNNPMYSSNKVLVNKEKFNYLTSNNEPVKVPLATEKIYYNPKFLINNVKSAANATIKPNSEQNIYENVKTFDSNIHINRHYFATKNNPNFASDDLNVNNRILNRGGIHINPKFIKKTNIKDEVDITQTNSSFITDQTRALTIENNSISNSSRSDFKPIALSKSKYKFIKTVTSPPKSQNNSRPLCIKTKYCIKRLNIAKSAIKESWKKETPKLKTLINSKMKIGKTSSEFNKLSKTKLVRKISSEFKKLSRTKLVRKSVLQSIILARRHSRNIFYIKSLHGASINKKVPLKKKSSNISYFPERSSQRVPLYDIYKKNNTIRESYTKVNSTSTNKNENICNHSFKRLSKMKIVRKSLLKAQIEARNQVKKQYLRDYKNLKFAEKYSKFYVRNDNIRKKYLVKQKALLSWIKKKQGPDASCVRCKKTTHSSKHLRKNNQPCPFFNRFGRCKGKDRGTCPKLHDSLYVSVCRKFLQGECNGKECLLSHDIRPGKMPTCHHYLAGLCTRPNCPYLHIKVNPKAPICMSFLQGFCPDVFNCLKRHEFICPLYAEKGTCPRGKSCTYPHRSPVVVSKLLKDDQKPLIHRTNSIINSSFKSNCQEVSESTENNKLEFNRGEEKKTEIQNSKICKKEYLKEAFTRYFDVTNSNENYVEDNELKFKENIVLLKNCDELR